MYGLKTVLVIFQRQRYWLKYRCLLGHLLARNVWIQAGLHPTRIPQDTQDLMATPDRISISEQNEKKYEGILIFYCDDNDDN